MTKKRLHQSCPLAIFNGRSAFGILFLLLGQAAFASASAYAQTVVANPDDNLQLLVNSNPSGTTFSLNPGIYRMQAVVPKDWDQFVGQPGAIVNGAALLKSFSQNGAYWVAPGILPQNFSYGGSCDSSHPACIYPEDLFFDGAPLTRAASLSAVGPGAWYLDYSAGTAYLGSNPAGHTVEISILPFAFVGTATGVTIRGLTIEKYATSHTKGAVNAQSAGGTPSQWWNVDSNEIRLNHGMGVLVSNGMYVHGNKIHHNGQLGLGGGATDATIQSNEVAFNNYAGFDYFWEAGGMKFAYDNNIKIQYNFVHDNNGPGIWADIDSRYLLIDGNSLAHNMMAGIFYEISYYGTIQNNYINNDGNSPFGRDIWWGGAILVSNSSNVEVSGNTVVNSMNGIGGILAPRGNDPQTGQPYLLQNLNVHDNTLSQIQNTAGGIIIEQNAFDTSVFTSWNNHFQNNTLALSPQASWAWMNQTISLVQWLLNPLLH